MNIHAIIYTFRFNFFFFFFCQFDFVQDLSRYLCLPNESKYQNPSCQPIRKEKKENRFGVLLFILPYGKPNSTKTQTQVNRGEMTMCVGHPMCFIILKINTVKQDTDGRSKWGKNDVLSNPRFMVPVIPTLLHM